MVEKVTIEITGEKAVVRLLDGDGKELNHAVTVPEERGLVTRYAKEPFDEMDEEVLTNEVLEALGSDFFIYEVLWALEELQ
ncbi:hypothetical protein [Bacillus phage SBSphiJ7]|nr:hypothetical protein [Bacillus phage SBSphiJ7]